MCLLINIIHNIITSTFNIYSPILMYILSQTIEVIVYYIIYVHVSFAPLDYRHLQPYPLHMVLILQCIRYEQLTCVCLFMFYINGMIIQDTISMFKQYILSLFTVVHHPSIFGSNDSRLHVVEPPRGRSFIWQIGVNSSIQDHRQVDRVFFMESSQSYAATLTHYSTEPLTTGPDYDPLLLLLALAGDVHPNPGPSRYPCSVCFKNVTSQGTSYLCTRCSHWVHSRCSGLRNAADYRKANGWICTACMTPPRPRTPSPPPSPAHMPTMSDKTFNILQWNANGIGNKQTELSIFLEAHNVKVAAIQESKLTAKSRSPNIQIHPSTT